MKLGGSDAVGLELVRTYRVVFKSSRVRMGLGEIVIEDFTPFALIGAWFG